VAWGRADESIIDVSGTLRSTTHPELVVRGRTIAFYPHDQGREDTRNRWVIVFRVPVDGTYRMTVVGQAENGATPSQSVIFSTVNHDREAATVIWPDENEDISDYKDDFCPYGSLTANPLGVVTLTGSHDVPLLFSYGDYTSLDLWTAQFDTVPSGSYTLSVRDNLGSGEDRHVSVD
jgi:hypothetical protein